MKRLSYLLMMARNMVELLSGRSIKNADLPALKPNKGKLKIFGDHLYEILTTGAIERGYWMYGFYNKPRSEQKKYVAYPDFMIKRNNSNMHPKATFITDEKFNYLCVLRDKFVFGRFLEQLGFPVAKDLLLIDGKNNTIRKLGSDSKPEPFENLTNYTFDAFCKVVSGECGKGVFRLTCDGEKLGGEVESIQELKKLIGNSLFVVQERLKQHDDLNRVYSGSINTMRLVTCRREDGTVTHLPAVMRFGAHGSTVDNWFAGGVAVAIDSDGRLKGGGLYEFPRRNTMFEPIHPDTKIKFDGYRIPMYEDAIKMAKELHSYLYGIPFIGWDIAFTPDGPVFIEGNDNFAITLNQAPHGGFKDLWSQAIGEK